MVDVFCAASGPFTAPTIPKSENQREDVSSHLEPPLDTPFARRVPAARFACCGRAPGERFRAARLAWRAPGVRRPCGLPFSARATLRASALTKATPNSPSVRAGRRAWPVCASEHWPDRSSAQAARHRRVWPSKVQWQSLPWWMSRAVFAFLECAPPSRTNSPACVDGDFPSRASRRARSSVLLFRHDESL